MKEVARKIHPAEQIIEKLMTAPLVEKVLQEFFSWIAGVKVEEKK